MVTMGEEEAFENIIHFIENHLEWCNKVDCSVCKQNREAIEFIKNIFKKNLTLKKQLEDMRIKNEMLRLTIEKMKPENINTYYSNTAHKENQ